MKKGVDDQIVQSFPYRCPYCDQTVAYEEIDLKQGENPIRCPSCRKVFIKVVSDFLKEGDAE